MQICNESEKEMKTWKNHKELIQLEDIDLLFMPPYLEGSNNVVTVLLHQWVFYLVMKYTHTNGTIKNNTITIINELRFCQNDKPSTMVSFFSRNVRDKPCHCEYQTVIVKTNPRVSRPVCKHFISRDTYLTWGNFIR